MSTRQLGTEKPAWQNRTNRKEPTDRAAHRLSASYSLAPLGRFSSPAAASMPARWELRPVGRVLLEASTREDAMGRLIQSVRRFMRSDDGPTAVEYAVMLSLIVVVCLASVRAIGTNAKASFQNVANSIAS